jgi:hypothetical protein
VGDPQATTNGRVVGFNRGLRLLTPADIAAPKVPSASRLEMRRAWFPRPFSWSGSAACGHCASRRKKNPSTISRSRSLASSAERRVVVGVCSRVSKAALGIARMTAEPRARSLWAGRKRWSQGPRHAWHPQAGGQPIGQCRSRPARAGSPRARRHRICGLGLLPRCRFRDPEQSVAPRCRYEPTRHRSARRATGRNRR